MSPASDFPMITYSSPPYLTAFQLTGVEIRDHYLLISHSVIKPRKFISHGDIGKQSVKTLKLDILACPCQA